MYYLSIVDWNFIYIFFGAVYWCTLTTTVQYWDDEETVFVAFDKLWKRIARRYPEAGCFIKKEYGARRGMLHYHLILFGIPDKSERVVHRWLLTHWQQCLSNEVKIVDVQRVESLPELVKYVCKYAGKWTRRKTKDTPQAPRVREVERAGGMSRLFKAHTSPQGEKAQNYFDLAEIEPQFDWDSSEMDAVSIFSEEEKEEEADENGVVRPRKGSRWWYKRGVIPICDGAEVRGDKVDDRILAYRMRRTLRSLIKARTMEAERYKLQHKLGLPARFVTLSDPIIKAYCVRKTRKRIEWLWKRKGFLIMVDGVDWDGLLRFHGGYRRDRHEQAEWLQSVQKLGVDKPPAFGHNI
jgi:hypothetical protein